MVRVVTYFRPFIVVGLLTITGSTSSCLGQSGTSSDSASLQTALRDSTDSYQRLIASAAHALDREDFGLAVMYAGANLQGTPYVAGLLDSSDTEELVISLNGFDCVLLVESALAAARAAAQGDVSVEAFAREIETLRYRDGKRRGYGSRLHYFSDWILNNHQRRIVEDVTLELGGQQYKHALHFMSANRSLYPKIADDDSLYSSVVDAETNLRDHGFYYIPQERISDAYSRIRAGDIIAITTSVEGLDISHTGIAYVKDGSVGFLHASTQEGVTVAPDLNKYVNNNATQTGIMVARPLIPMDNE